MKEAPGSVITAYRQEEHKAKMRFTIQRCSICTRHIWFSPSYLTEPEGVPEARLSWVLCKRCYHALTIEMHNSPVLSPLRLRIAIGMVAAKYWPQAYPTRIQAYISDRKWIVFIAIGFIVAMIVHLALFVMIGSIR